MKNTRSTRNKPHIYLYSLFFIRNPIVICFGGLFFFYCFRHRSCKAVRRMSQRRPRDSQYWRETSFVYVNINIRIHGRFLREFVQFFLCLKRRYVFFRFHLGTLLIEFNDKTLEDCVELSSFILGISVFESVSPYDTTMLFYRKIIYFCRIPS